MYQVNILTSKEFDKVAKSNPRYKYVDGDNLGFADPVENKAYVRHTAFPELNKYLIEHEFEHLLEEKGTDQDALGIRHKKKSGFAKLITQATSLLSPVSNTFSNVRENSVDPISGALMSSGGSKEVTPEETAKSYQNAFGTTGAQYGNVGGTPQVTQSSSLQGPEIGGSLYQGGLNNQQNQQQIDPELQKRISGFFGGRIPF